jgi:hypothetical protein
VSLMKLKIAVRLAMDVVRLRLGSNERTRVMLTQDVDAWKAVLRGVPEDSSTNLKPRASR